MGEIDNIHEEHHRHVHHTIVHSFMQFLAPCVITRMKCIITSNKHILLLCTGGQPFSAFAVLFPVPFGPTSRNKQPYVNHTVNMKDLPCTHVHQMHMELSLVVKDLHMIIETISHIQISCIVFVHIHMYLTILLHLLGGKKTQTIILRLCMLVWSHDQIAKSLACHCTVNAYINMLKHLCPSTLTLTTKTQTNLNF